MKRSNGDYRNSFKYKSMSEDTRKNVDSIKVVKKRKSPKTLKKKSLNHSWFILIIVPSIILLSFIFVNLTSNLIKLSQLFYQGKYLVIFQNNAEMRPTGGFIGSFAVIDFDKYKIKSIDLNSNILKLDNAFKAEHVVEPPKPLASISNNQWSLCDANFAVSFPEAAEKIEWFYEQETGSKVDGVIAINASLIHDLLSKIGAIELKEFNTTITHENFFTELAQKIEQDYYKDSENRTINEPKSILNAMMPEVFSKTLKLGKFELLNIFKGALKNKDIMLYSNNVKIQNAVLNYNWGGKVNATYGDYLQVNNANIADGKSVQNVGGKSSLNVRESLDYNVVSRGDSVTSELAITRYHEGSYVWPDGVNHSWSKTLVPLGSKLVSAELNGMDIVSNTETGEEAGKNYFATWVDVKPGETSILKLTYDNPTKQKNYRLMIQKQPGNPGDDLSVTYLNKALYNGILNYDLEIHSKYMWFSFLKSLI